MATTESMISAIDRGLAGLEKAPGLTRKQKRNAMTGGGYRKADKPGMRGYKFPQDEERLMVRTAKRGGKLAALVNTGDAIDDVKVGDRVRARGVRIPDVKMHIAPGGHLAAAPQQGPAKPKRKKAAKKRPGKAYRNWKKAASKKAKPAKKRKARFAKGSPAAIAWGKKMKAARAAAKGGKKPAKRKAAKKAVKKPAKRKVGNARKSIRKSSAAKKRTYKGARYMTQGENKSAKRMRAKPLRESYAGPRAFGRS